MISKRNQLWNANYLQQRCVHILSEFLIYKKLEQCDTVTATALSRMSIFRYELQVDTFFWPTLLRINIFKTIDGVVCHEFSTLYESTLC